MSRLFCYKNSYVHTHTSVQAVIYLRLYSYLNFSCYKNRIWLLSHFIIVENIHMMYSTFSVQHYIDFTEWL